MPPRTQRSTDGAAQALECIRGVCLGPLKPRKAVALINEIVGEALYGDFEGTVERAYESGEALR